MERLMSLTLPPVDREALVATRRDLHEHPELGFQETRTSTLVADRLKSLGYQVKTGVGRTGVVAVKFAFQPAEEISSGAEAMIRDGLLDAPSVEAAFGIHLWNDLPAGTIGLMPGPVMASVDEFEITILGHGGHAAAPQQTIDPVLIAA